ncbi:MAG: hypothetical protein ACLS61_09725 [Ruminococcus sp.]
MEVITKNATPYDVDGNKGITYRLVVMADNDVEKLKVVDEKTYNLFPSQDRSTCLPDSLTFETHVVANGR